MTEVFKAKLRKIGNSLGIIVPARILEGLNMHKGDVVHVVLPPSDTLQRNSLLIKLAGIDKDKPGFQRDKEDRY